MKSLLKTVNCFEHEGVPVMRMNMRPTRCLAFMILLVVLLGGPTSLWALTLGDAKPRDWSEKPQRVTWVSYREKGHGKSKPW